jgi:hypothetical protein
MFLILKALYKSFTKYLVQISAAAFFFSAQHPNRLWGPPSLISNDWRGASSSGESGLDVKLTPNIHLVPRLRMVQLYLHYPTRLHGTYLT